MQPAGAPRPTGTVTGRGLRIPLAAFVAHLGGAHAFRAFLKNLTVFETGTPLPLRRRQPRARRSAYRAGPAAFYVPRVQAPALLARQLLGAVQVEAAHAEACRLGGGLREVPPVSWRAARPFYDYQLAAVAHLCGPAGPLAPGAAGVAYLQMGAGLGKSRLGMAVAARGRGPVFVVVPTKAVRSQWVDEFREVFPGLTVGEYVNDPRRAAGPATHDVLVGIVNTVRRKPPGFFAGFATVILDEVHEYSSVSNLEVLWLVQGVARVLGLSATPDDRPDGLDRVVSLFLGPPLRAETEIPGFSCSAVRFRGRVRVVEYVGDPAFCAPAVSAGGTVCAIGTIAGLIQDPARLRLVAAEVARLSRLHETEGGAALRDFGLGPRPSVDATPVHPAGGVRAHGVFVFAEHRAYLPALRDALLAWFAPDEVAAPELDGEGGDPLRAWTTAPDEEGGPDGEGRVGPEGGEGPPDGEGGEGPPDGGGGGGGARCPSAVILRGGASREQVARARRARIVLTTYGYSRRGVSIVEMTAIVLATPRRNGLNQILGRITRRGSDESILRLVVDIKDLGSPLKRQIADRVLVYKKNKYPIFRVRVAHTDYASAGAAALPTAAEVAVWAPADGGPVC